MKGLIDRLFLALGLGMTPWFGSAAYAVSSTAFECYVFGFINAAIVLYGVFNLIRDD